MSDIATTDDPTVLEGQRRIGVGARPIAAIRSIEHFGIYFGLVAVAAGVALVALAWGRTAGLTEVGLQVPYVVSAGCTGLALVVVGLTAVNITVRWEEAAARARRAAELRQTLGDILAEIESLR